MVNDKMRDKVLTLVLIVAFAKGKADYFAIAITVNSFSSLSIHN